MKLCDAAWRCVVLRGAACGCAMSSAVVLCDAAEHCPVLRVHACFCVMLYDAVMCCEVLRDAACSCLFLRDVYILNYICIGDVGCEAGSDQKDTQCQALPTPSLSSSRGLC